MIPVELRLRNFLSYGEEVPPLDFSEFEVACLSGQNGHGKSAILDAITWALWGEGRKASGDRKAYEGLLRLGQSEMEVGLVFDLEGERYRVWRRWRKKAKGGDASLEFHVLDHEKQEYIPLTTGSIGETQAKINQFLRMDYVTFINSAFILQGRADEFTRQTATRRKQILFEILGLDRYEELAKKAKEHRDQAEQQRMSLQARLDLIEGELKDEPVWRKQAKAIESELEQLREQAAVREGELVVVQERRAELLAKQGRVRELSAELQRLQRDLTEMERDRQKLESEQRQDEARLQHQVEISERYRRYRELNGLREEWLAKFRGYSALEARAVDLEKTIALAKSRLERELQAAASRREELLRAIEEANRRLVDEGAVEAGYTAWQQAKAAENAMQAKWQQLHALEEQRSPLAQAVQQAERLLAVELARVEAQLQDEGKRVQEQARWQAAREQALAALERLTAIEHEREQVRERGTAANNELTTLAGERKRLEMAIVEAEEKLSLLTHSAGATCPLCHHDLDANEASGLERQLRGEIQAMKRQIQAIEQTGKETSVRIAALRERFRVLDTELKQKPTVDQAMAVAEAGLAEARRAGERAGQLEERVAILRQQLTAREYAQEKQAALAAVNDKIQSLAFDAQSYQAVGIRRQQLEPYLARYTELQAAKQRRVLAQSELPTAEQNWRRLSEQLTALRYADGEQAELAATRQRQLAIGYNREQHDAVQQEWEQVQDAPLLMERLQQASVRLERNCERVADLMDRLSKVQASCVDLTLRRDGIQQELAMLPKVLSHVAELENELRGLRNTREEKAQVLGGLKARLAACSAMREERVGLEMERRTAAEEKSLYDQLVVAFGKDGIPALIVEQAIPEIEAEANEILGRLTDHTTQLSIESRKETASGARETLEIKISDELGTRDYELYSGGEAFRCDFALRIALSKLLARRSGTRLRTLVIDEGFGTQDDQGLEHLVEAIQAVRSDFDKILVITHLEALKNAFPVRIEVTKYPEVGSRFEVIHLG